MLQSSDDATRFLASGPTLFEPGWRAVDSFDDAIEHGDDDYDDDEDGDEYESEEEELYVTLDLGTTLDTTALQTETQYQLIGIDTPLPFLKLGNQIFQGEVIPLIGDEVILGLVRNRENPHQPSHPPLYTSSYRISFRGVTLEPLDKKDTIVTASADGVAAGVGGEEVEVESRLLEKSQGKGKGKSKSKSHSPEKKSTSTTINAEAGPSQLTLTTPPPPPRVPRPLPKSSLTKPSIYTPKVIISDPGELALLDFSTIPQGLRIGLTVEVGSTLNLIPTTTTETGEELIVLTKTELERAIYGRPERGPGSRGPRGGKHKARGRARDLHKVLKVEEMSELQVQSKYAGRLLGSTGASAIASTRDDESPSEERIMDVAQGESSNTVHRDNDGDVEMGEAEREDGNDKDNDEDDPPWQEVW